PCIELSDLWRDTEKAFAQVTAVGFEIKFSRSAFEVLPERAAKFLIAHELAHVYQKAIGIKPGGASEDQNENDANNLASTWGFDEIGLHDVERLLQRFRLAE